MSLLVRKAEGLREFGFVCFIRTKVYVIEQECPCLEEFDEQEGAAIHYLGWVDGQPVTTCRTLFPGDGIAKIGRIATLPEHRGKGYASSLLTHVMAEIAADEKIKEIRMSAQDHAIGLYEKMGFKAYGEGYREAGIPHHMMSKILKEEV